VLLSECYPCHISFFGPDLPFYLFAQMNFCSYVGSFRVNLLTNVISMLIIITVKSVTRLKAKTEMVLILHVLLVIHEELEQKCKSYGHL
jgi:branched-subunit amino acid transport protein AzlD